MKKDEKNFQAEWKVYENTWSKQRAKRRKQIHLKIDLTSLDESNDESNETCTSNLESTSIERAVPSETATFKSELLFEFEFRIKFKPNITEQIIMLEMKSVDMVMSHTREYLNQILQFVKNSIFK